MLELAFRHPESTAFVVIVPAWPPIALVLEIARIAVFLDLLRPFAIQRRVKPIVHLFNGVII